MTIDYVDAKVEGRESIFTFKGRQLSFTGDKMGENCEFQYKWDFGNGITSASQSTIYTYTSEGTYYPSFTASCKKCGPSKSDGVMVVVGCPDTYADPTMCCVPPGMMIQNSPIENLSLCPNRVQKSGYDPSQHYNGCGSGWTDYIVPDNPMYFAHKMDTAYLLLHGANDGDFTTPCNGHDICYGTCKSYKEQCDATFFNRLREVCERDYSSAVDTYYLNECLIYAEIYYQAVSRIGDNAWTGGQKDACNCCKP